MGASAGRSAARAAVAAGVLLALGCTASRGGSAAGPSPGLRGRAVTAGATATAGTRPGRPVTVYVMVDSGNGTGSVVPVQAATGTAGPAIGLGVAQFIPDGIAVTPDGATAYVIDGDDNFDGNVVPIRMATHTAGPVISAGDRLVAIVVTPDGKTAYALSGEGGLYPISTATGGVGSVINVGAFPQGIAMTPDGTTAYVAATAYVAPHDYEIVTPVRTATNTAGRAFSIGPPVSGGGSGSQVIAVTPDGKTAYVASYDAGTVIPVNTVSGTYGPPIKVGSGPCFIAVTPDGKTATS
jgi:DNA-binding beta-propeller fold protein YncE